MPAGRGGADNFERRYVYAGGELLMQYEGPGISDRRYFHADERGWIVAVSNSAAAVTAVNRCPHVRAESRLLLQPTRSARERRRESWLCVGWASQW